MQGGLIHSPGVRLPARLISLLAGTLAFDRRVGLTIGPAPEQPKTQ